MFQNKIISEYTLKLIKLCHFLKKFLEGTCPPPPQHLIYRMIDLPSTLTIQLCLY